MLLVTAATFDISSVHADENWYFVQAMCVPELRMFQINRLHTTNIPHGGEILDKHGIWKRKAEDDIAHRHGVYGWSVLKRSPVPCHVKGWVSSGGTIDSWPGFDVKIGATFDRESASVEVDGKQIGEIALDLEHGWKGTSSITVWDDGVNVAVKICSDGAGLDGNVVCKQRYLSEYP